MARSPTSSNIKDSIEDLPSSVPRSPQATDSPRRYNLKLDLDQIQSSLSQQSSPLLPELDGLRIDKAESHAASRSVNQDVYSNVISSAEHPAPSLDSGSPRPRKKHRKVSHPELMLDGDSLGFDHQIPRPMSPFTPAGLLRRLTSNEAILRPPSRARGAELCVVTQVRSEEHAGATSGGGKEGREGKLLGGITKVQGSGHPFLGFLGRRSDRRSAT